MQGFPSWECGGRFVLDRSSNQRLSHAAEMIAKDMTIYKNNTFSGKVNTTPVATSVKMRYNKRVTSFNETPICSYS